MGMCKRCKYSLQPSGSVLHLLDFPGMPTLCLFFISKCFRPELIPHPFTQTKRSLNEQASTNKEFSGVSFLRFALAVNYQSAAPVGSAPHVLECSSSLGFFQPERHSEITLKSCQKPEETHFSASSDLFWSAVFHLLMISDEHEGTPRGNVDTMKITV